MQYPFSSILGSEAQVRLLRVLLNEIETPLGVGQLAFLAGISPQWVRKALNRLVESGIALRIGGGRALKFGIRTEHPLTAALRSLFTSEQDNFEEFISNLKAILLELHEIHQAWLEPLPAKNNLPVEIKVVAQAKAIEWIEEELRARLISVEKRFDTIIEIGILTKADAPSPPDKAIFLVVREPAVSDNAKNTIGTHQQPPQRSMQFAKGIAHLIQAKPTLIKRAKNHLNLLLRENQGSAAADISEWKQLLETYSPEKLQQLLISDTSRADRLRQSSPFFAILTAEERDELIAFMEKLP